MSRIKITLPKAFTYSTTIDVLIGDINYGGHLWNDAYLRIAHEARIRFLKAQSWSEKDIDGLSLIMSDAAIQFQGEVFHGDRLNIDMVIDGVNRRGFDLYYQFTNADTAKSVAKVKTGMILFNYEKNTMASATEQTQQKLKAFCAE